MYHGNQIFLLKPVTNLRLNSLLNIVQILIMYLRDEYSSYLLCYLNEILNKKTLRKINIHVHV